MLFVSTRARNFANKSSKCYYAALPYFAFKCCNYRDMSLNCSHSRHDNFVARRISLNVLMLHLQICAYERNREGERKRWKFLREQLTFFFARLVTGAIGINWYAVSRVIDLRACRRLFPVNKSTWLTCFAGRFWIRKRDREKEPTPHARCSYSLANAASRHGRPCRASHDITNAITALKIDIFQFIAKCVILSESRVFSAKGECAR